MLCVVAAHTSYHVNFWVWSLGINTVIIVTTETVLVLAGLPVVHILFKNLEDFLPASLVGSDVLPDGASVVYSTQIGDKELTKRRSQAIEENKISLKFTFEEVYLYTD